MSAPRWALIALVCASAASAQTPPPPPSENPAPPAAAPASQEPPPPVTALPVKVGVAGVATSWFVPIQAELVSETALDARVELVDEDGLTLHEWGEVSFVAGEAHRLQTLLSASKLERTDGVALRLTPSQGGGAWLTGEAKVNPKWTGLVLVLDKHGALPANESNLRPTYEPVAMSQAARLPEHSMAYAGTSAVLLGDLSLESWSDAQARALATWVKRGGHLMVSVGPRARALKRSPLGKHLGDYALGALPDAAPERGPLPEADLTALSQNLSEAAPLSPVVPAGWARLLRGPQDLSQDRGGTPLVATRRVGRGVIDVIAVDLWSEPFQFTPQTEFLLRTRLDSARSAFESRSALLKPALTLIPPPSSLGPVFALLIFYAMIAGPGVYFLLRGKKRGLWLWIAIPALTLTCTLCMPIYRLSLADAESSLVGVSLIEQRQGEPEALETVDLLVFSGGLDDKRLEFEGEDPTLIGVTPTGFHFLGDAPDALDVDLPIALWGARYVSLESAREPLDLEASLERPMWDDPVLSLTTRRTPRIQRLWVVVPGPGGYLVHAHEEPVLANEEQRLELSLAQYRQDPATTPHATLVNNLIEHLCGVELESNLDRAYLLVEFVDRLRATVHPNVLARESWSFAAIEIPQVYTQGYPLGLGGLVPIQQEVRSVAVAGIDSSQQVHEAVYTLHVPHPPQRLELLLGPQRLPELETRLEAYVPGDDRWVPLREETPEVLHDNRISLSAHDPDGLDPRTLYDPRTGSVRLRQRVTLPRGSVAKGRWIQSVQVQQLVWDPDAVDPPVKPVEDELAPDSD